MSPAANSSSIPKQTPTVYTVSPDGAAIATVTAGTTATVQISDLKTGERRAVLQNEQEVQQLSFAPIGRLLATGAVDGVRIWQMPDGQLLRTVAGGTFHALSRDGRTLALERGRDVAVIEVSSGAVKQTLPATVSQLRFSEDGTLLAGWNNQVLIVWETATGKVLPHVEVVSARDRRARARQQAPGRGCDGSRRRRRTDDRRGLARSP